MKLDFLVDKLFYKTELILPKMNDKIVLEELKKVHDNLNKAEVNRNTITKELYFHTNKEK